MRKTYKYIEERVRDLGNGKLTIGVYNKFYKIENETGSKQYFIGTVAECDAFLDGFQLAKQTWKH